MAVNGNVEVGGYTNQTSTGRLIVSGSISGPNFNINSVTTGQKTAPHASKPPPVRLYDDFNFVTNTFYYTGVSSTGTAAGGVGGITPPTGAGNGFIQLSTTTGATNGFVIMAGYNSLLGRFASFRARQGFWMPNLSDGTDTYTTWVGSFSTVGLSPSRQCIYLRYTDSVNGGRFQVLTNNGGTTTDTGVTVAANTFYVFDYTVTVSAPDTINNPVSWNLYASGSATPTASGTGSVGAPATWGGGGALETAMLGAMITKSVGTTARTLMVDFWEFVGLYS